MAVSMFQRWNPSSKLFPTPTSHHQSVSLQLLSPRGALPSLSPREPRVQHVTILLQDSSCSNFLPIPLPHSLPSLLLCCRNHLLLTLSLPARFAPKPPCLSLSPPLPSLSLPLRPCDVEDRDPVAPPQLPADAPVLDALQPEAVDLTAGCAHTASHCATPCRTHKYLQRRQQRC